MSKGNVEERIVKLSFENTGFEAGATKAIAMLDKLKSALKFDSMSDGLSKVKGSIDSFNLDHVSDEINETQSQFGVFEAFVAGIFMRLGSRVADFGLNMAKNLTVKPIMDGFGEYETQMKSVQTILSNTREGLKEAGITEEADQVALINSKLDELNTYADKTIYNFSEMTRNIGTFTAAGVDLETATSSIQGIANLAAASGSTSQQASTAMYQLSQAIAAGSVKLQDWNSVVNAGMGGELFQNALKRTARAHGVAVDEMIEKTGSFRESLREGWITSDILTETLGQLTMATEGLTEAEIEEMKQSLINQGYTREDAEAILDLANNAQDAATKVRTWSQLWETVGESLGSGWATTWRTIVGDFLEATDLFTHLSEGITGIIGASADARNKVLADWAAAGGRTALVDGIKYSFDAIVSIVQTIGDAFSDVFGISAEQLYNITTAFGEFAAKLVPGKEAVQFLYDVLYDVFTVIHSVLGVFGNFVRILFNVAKAIWTVISPFVKLAAYLGKGVLNIVARLSSALLWLSDRLEEFVGILTGGFGWAINLVYGTIGAIAGVFVKIGQAIGGVLPLLTGFKDALFNAVKESGPVKSLVESFDKFKTTVSEKFTSKLNKFKDAIVGTNKAQKKAATNFKDMSPYEKALTIFEDLQSRVTNFAEAFANSGDKVEFLKSKIEPVLDSIKNKFTELRDFVKTPFNFYDIFEGFDNNNRRGILSMFGDNETGRRVLGIYSSVMNPIRNFLKDTIGVSDTWGETFSNIFEKFVKATGPVGDAVSKVKDYFTNLFGSGKSIPQIAATMFFDAYDAIKNGISKIPEIISKAKETIPKKFEELQDKFRELRYSFGDKLRDIFTNLPSPGEVVTSIGNFFKDVKDFISKKFSELFSKADSEGGFDASKMFAFIPNMFSKLGDFLAKIDLSKYASIAFDVVSGFIDSVFTGIKTLLSKIDFEKLESVVVTLIGKVTKFLSKRGYTLLLIGIADFLHSFSVLNTGIGKFGKGFGKTFKRFGKDLSDGMASFGEGFFKHKQQTKSDAFKKIATGILLLAGALFILSKIPADRLWECVGAMSAIAVIIGILTIAMAKISKSGDLDIESAGKSFQGLGVALLAAVGALWLLTKMPKDDNLKTSLEILTGMFVAMTGALILIGRYGEDISGAASAILAMAGAIALLVIPIALLGLMPLPILKQGFIAVGLLAIVLSACVALMEKFSKKKTSIAGAAAPILALAVAITLLLIPITILGLMPFKMLIQGGIAVALIGAVLSGCVTAIGRFAKSAGVLAAASIALIALVLAVTLAIIPITILGLIPLPVLKQGGIAAGVIAGVLTACIYALGTISAGAFAILAATVGLIGLTIAIGLMTLVIDMLMGIARNADWDLIGKTIALFATIVGGIVGLALTGFAGGAGLIVLTVGILGFTAAMAALGWMIDSLDLRGMASEIAAFFATTTQAVYDAWSGMLNALNECPIMRFFNAFFELGAALIDGVRTALDSHSPSRKMEEVGNDAVDGILLAIANRLGEFLGMGENSGQQLIDGLKDLPTKATEKANEFLTNFLNGIDIQQIVDKGLNITQGLIDGIKGQAWQALTNIPGDIFNAITGKLKSLFGIQSPSTYMQTEIGGNVIQGLINGLSDEGLLGGLVNAGVGLFNAVKNGVANLPGTLASTAASAGNWFIDKFGGFIKPAEEKGAALGSAASSGVEGTDVKMGSAATAGVRQFVAKLSVGAAKAKMTTVSMVATIRTALNALVNVMKSAATKGGNAFVAGIKAQKGRAHSSAAGLVSAARSGLSNLYPAFRQVGMNAGRGFINGLDSMLHWVRAAANRMATAAVKEAKRVTKEKSPSRVFKEIGFFAGEGFVIGIDKSVPYVAKASRNMANQSIDSFESALGSAAINIEDILDTDYNPVITPVINPTQFDYDLSMLSSRLNGGIVRDLNVGSLNYTGEIIGKFDDIAELNRSAMEQLAENAIDYNKLGVSVANALINAGVHVEMDGGQLMGYLAGEIADASRMQGRR